MMKVPYKKGDFGFNYEGIDSVYKGSLVFGQRQNKNSLWSFRYDRDVTIHKTKEECLCNFRLAFVGRSMTEKRDNQEQRVYANVFDKEFWTHSQAWLYSTKTPVIQYPNSILRLYKE